MIGKVEGHGGGTSHRVQEADESDKAKIAKGQTTINYPTITQAR